MDTIETNNNFSNDDIPVLIDSSISSSNADIFAFISMIFGILSLCLGFIIGFFACPFILIGIIFGILGLKSLQYRWVSILGLVLSIGTLLFQIFCVGLYMIIMILTAIASSSAN